MDLSCSVHIIRPFFCYFCGSNSFFPSHIIPKLGVDHLRCCCAIAAAPVYELVSLTPANMAFSLVKGVVHGG